MQEKSTALRADLSVDDSSVAAKVSEVDRDDVGALMPGSMSEPRTPAAQLSLLADEWFASHAWDDLSLLDDISRGEFTTGSSAYGGSFEAYWRQSHNWLKRRLLSSSGEDEASDGADSRVLSLLNDGSTYTDPMRSPIGLRGVAGHDLKSFTGLREGVYVLAQ